MALENTNRRPEKQRRFEQLRFSKSGLCVMSLLSISTIAVALPMAFEFRQRVSVGGVTLLELWLLPTLLLLFVMKPQATTPKGYAVITALLYASLIWFTARAVVGIMEGNEPIRALRDMRNYLPLLMLPPLLHFLNVWQPNRAWLLQKTTRILVFAYLIYALFLVAVVVSPTLSDLFLMKAFLYRIGSNTFVISVTLLLSIFFLWREKLISFGLLAIAITSVGVTLLLAQSRMGTAMLTGLVLLAICLYTVRSYGGRFAGIGFALLASVVVAAGSVFIYLNRVIPDFEEFAELFFERIERQEEVGLWEAATKYSFGTEAYRTRVVNAAIRRPLLGYGSGEDVGEVMASEEGAYIDSTAITMWYKNGAVGVVLYYGFWLSILGRLVRGYFRYGGRLEVGVASIAVGSIATWLLWSTANVFLMYGWVLYPVVALVSIWLFVLQPTGVPQRRLDLIQEAPT